MAEVTAVDPDITYSDDLWQQRATMTITDETGRTVQVEAEFYAHYTLIPSDKLHLREGAARTLVDGEAGTGWMEVAWPPAYLDYVKENGPY